MYYHQSNIFSIVIYVWSSLKNNADLSNTLFYIKENKFYCPLYYERLISNGTGSGEKETLITCHLILTFI